MKTMLRLMMIIYMLNRVDSFARASLEHEEKSQSRWG